ncbi:MAG TPA: LysR family transcriptional regulator, partial [Brevundimonas sp.]|nr:LysR family transcriptional regulator [Brevundimonas sp.]
VFRARSRVRTNSSEVARELALAGAGVALRSTWDVGDELRDGRLKVVLPQYAGSSDVAIFALTAGRARAETRVRAFIDFLSGLYGETPEWDR